MIQVHPARWSPAMGWIVPLDPEFSPSLCLVFGPAEALQDGLLIQELCRDWPEMLILGCSTAGQISDIQLYTDQVVLTALHFEQTRLKLVQAHLPQASDSFQVGQGLAHALKGEELQHVLVLAEGLKINGSGLVDGLQSQLPAAVSLSGGLAGDDGAFTQTLICTQAGVLSQQVAALGLYGKALKVGCGSAGGWDPFGPERLITRSEGNELFEMDGQPALELYAHYLGPYADGLPATGLLFPLEIRQGTEQPLVRTILGVNPDKGSLIFAGDVPVGCRARLMKANIDRLLDGAAEAAFHGRNSIKTQPQWALLVSCYGRKMLLKQRTEEELEEVKQVLGRQATLTGFYSYGEISPGISMSASELHNQTMTVTTFAEAELI